MSGEKLASPTPIKISLLALEQSAQAARTIVRDAGTVKCRRWAVEHPALYTSLDPLQSMTREESGDSGAAFDSVARAADSRVQEVTASRDLASTQVDSGRRDHGTLAADVRPLVRLSVSVQVEDDGKRERGASGGGVSLAITTSLPTLTAKCAPMPGEEAVRMAPANLSAVAAPAVRCRWCWARAGRAYCCMKRSVTGLEGDFNRRGTSVFSGQMGQLAALNSVPLWMMARWSTVAAPSD
ncbi:hypothetical protein ACNKHQ_18935 [Shigella flexneri]